jgi:acyl-homoserine lactone acylase PvdQ
MDRRTRGAIATGLVITALTWMTFHGLLFHRPLPTIDGYYRFLGLDERAEVVRDAFGVPRIEAGTLHDLFFLQGYVTAQDRFAQMEAMRRSPQMREVFVSAAGVLDPRVGAAFEAYAAGVTKWIEQHVQDRALPASIALSGLDPVAWTPMHSRSIIAVYLGTSTGSSCVVTDEDRSTHGRPLLAAELEATAPGPGWYEIALGTPGIQAVGLSFPGVPGIIAGHNGRAAWSLHASEGRWSAVAAEARLVTALSAEDASAFIRPGPETGPFAGCAADVGGLIGALPPHRETPSGEVFLAGSQEETAALLQRLPSTRDLDVDTMRVTLGSPTSGSAKARIIIDLGDLDASRAALSTGQSGHRAADHYRDQAQLWTTGQMHRLAWTRDAVARTEGRLVLRPR